MAELTSDGEMLCEIRNYHFDPNYFEGYKTWGREEAGPFLRAKMDVVCAWYTNEMPPIYGDSLPQDETAVPANVAWIIRWRDREHRDRV